MAGPKLADGTKRKRQACQNGDGTYIIDGRRGYVLGQKAGRDGRGTVSWRIISCHVNSRIIYALLAVSMRQKKSPNNIMSKPDQADPVEIGAREIDARRRGKRASSLAGQCRGIGQVK